MIQIYVYYIMKVVNHTTDVMNLVNFDSTRKVYMAPEDDVWYQLKFDEPSGSFVIIHYDRSQPLYHDNLPTPKLRRTEIRKVLQTTYQGSTSLAYTVFSKTLATQKDLRRLRELKDYKYDRKYTLPAGSKRDLTNIANYLKMPEDFKRFFFKVDDDTLYIRTIVTQADINKEKLNTRRMEDYLNTLKSFDFIDKKAGWNKDGMPPLLKKNRAGKK